MNPFLLSPARKDDFINRENIIKEIINHVLGKGLGDIWIEGERQVGKTSLLQYIENKGDDFIKTFNHYHTERELKPVFLYLNVQALGSEKEFYKLLADCLKTRFDIKIKIDRETHKYFITHLKYVYELEFYPVFLIDEFDSMLENIGKENLASFVKKLNATMEHIPDLEHKPKIFGCVFAANTSFNELLYDLDCKEFIGSGLKFEALELNWFNYEQVKLLANTYIKNATHKLTAKEIDLCFKCTQGYPYFTQKMFRLIYQTKIENIQSKNITQYIKDEFGKEFENTIKAWGAQKMPKRTGIKLRELAEKAGEKLFEIGMRVLEAYLKSKF